MDNSDPIKTYWKGFAIYYQENLEEPNLLSALALSKMLRLESVKNILEVGCGGGSLALHLLEHLPPGIKYTSLDYSEEMIKAAKERKESVKHKLNDIDHSFFVGNAENLESMPDESVDAYMAPLCIHCMSDAEKALKEAMRVVKKGGRIGISVLGTEEKNTFYKIMDDRIFEVIERKPMRSIYHLGDHEVLVNLARDAGIEVDYCWDHDVPFDLFDEDDLEKLKVNPNFKRYLVKAPEDVRMQILEKIKKDFVQVKKSLAPLKLTDVLLIGRKPK